MFTWKYVIIEYLSFLWFSNPHLLYPIVLEQSSLHNFSPTRLIINLYLATPSLGTCFSDQRFIFSTDIKTWSSPAPAQTQLSWAEFSIISGLSSHSTTWTTHGLHNLTNSKAWSKGKVVLATSRPSIESWHG